VKLKAEVVIAVDNLCIAIYDLCIAVDKLCIAIYDL